MHQPPLSGMIWPRANAAWFTGILGGLRARHLEPVRSNALQAHPGAVPFRVCGSVSHALVAFNARDAGCSALLYAAGINAFGELGNGTTDRARRGENVLEMHGIEHIAAGNGFTLVAARDGLYGCGTTARGQLGIQGRDTLLSMTQIPLPRPAARITDLSAGMDHVLLLQDASVFATGLNTDGQLAKPAVIPYATQFTHVALPEGVLPTRVIAGGDTSMVLTSSGNVFVWGNTEYGQALQAATVDQLRTPTEVDVGISVVDACLGGSFLLFLDDCGTLHTAGYGAIGYEAPSTMLLRPLALPEKVTCIAAGLDYAAAATDAGNVYVWGIVHGEPGDTHLCPEHVAVPFDGTRPRRITDLACARGALLVLGEKHL